MRQRLTKLARFLPRRCGFAFVEHSGHPGRWNDDYLTNVAYVVRRTRPPPDGMRNKSHTDLRDSVVIFGPKSSTAREWRLRSSRLWLRNGRPGLGCGGELVPQTGSEP